MDCDKSYSIAKVSVARTTAAESVEPEKRAPLFIFPKPLPHVQLSSIIDDTTFTLTEKSVLRNALVVLKPRFHTHAIEIFLNFFTDNYTLLDRFCGKNGKFHLDNLNQHAKSVLDIYERLITDGLNMPTLIHILLVEVVIRHNTAGVKPSEINAYGHAIGKYFINVVQNISSPTLKIAFEKLSDTITSYHEGIQILGPELKMKMRDTKSDKSIIKVE